MKHFIIIFLSLVLFTQNKAFSQEQEHHAQWEESYSIALEKAISQEKDLLLFFTGSDWCGPCKMLEKDFFSTQQFKRIAEKNFILYEADFPRAKDILTKEQKEANRMLSRKYKVGSYPTLIVTNTKGEKLGIIKGYSLMRMPKYHFDFLEKYILK